ncbi:LacI family DNA-binding transcriptional regulator [Paenibacillus sp. NPDC056579]|uniref:LacI family DNA-binding transcriptional regulator n=1 Tax=unclassified Paenibacillus TaxID=185978 RepID=UPI001EF87D06|nr:LacI family DNA-binding transcriptional regulator [Paenibacillus sp. H1-7]
MKIEDIAKLANVSKSAVSLALNGKPGISPETRLKIINIAKEGGYIPRTQSRPEKTGGTSQILRFVACTNSGIVSEHYAQQPFFMELIRCFEEQCRTNGYSLLFSSVPSDQLEQQIDQLETENESNGIILLGTNLSREQIRLITNIQPNLVVLDTCFETEQTNFIVMNNRMGAYQAAQHLLELGHRRIGYVQSSYRMYNFDRRKQGFLACLEENGESLKDSDVFASPPTAITAQPSLVSLFLERKGSMPTALFCECDYIAISVIKSLAEAGLRVPDDISVVGFDNIHESVVITPELTTIHVEKETIAEMAVKKLMSMIDNGDRVNIKAFVDTRLVVRKSSRALQD